MRSAGSEVTIREAIRDLLEMGSAEYQYARMVRAILFHQAGIGWEELAALVEEDAAAR